MVYRAPTTPWASRAAPAGNGTAAWSWSLTPRSRWFGWRSTRRTAATTWAWEGDEYSLTLALDLETVRDLRQNVPYMLGPPPARIPAYATVTCLCRPLKPDSVRGTFTLATRGLRQITGRVDATLYFTEWNDAARHVSYPLHQRIDLLK